MTREELEKEAKKYAEKHIFYDEGRERHYYDKTLTEIFKDGAEFGYNKANEWHKLSEKYPEADKIVRVHLMSGMEHICETCYYEPTEDEIGYGKLVINFYELNGEWVDDNDIVAWCEIEPYKEIDK